MGICQGETRVMRSMAASQLVERGGGEGEEKGAESERLY